MDNFSYVGKINLKLKYKDKILDFSGTNSGSKNLFQAFADFLAGNVDKIYSNGIIDVVPCFIDIRHPLTDGSDTTESILKVEASIPITRIDISKTNTNTDNTNVDYPHTSITYEATLTYNYIRQELLNSYDDDHYMLCLCDTHKRILAYKKDIARSYITNITPGTQAIISWTLEIANKAQ